MRRIAGTCSLFWIGLSAVLMLGPAAFNRGPILYPDSVGYFRSGEAALEVFEHKIKPASTAVAPTPRSVTIDTAGDGVSTNRSVYYGLLVAPLYSLGGTWLIVAAQALMIASTLVVSFRRMGVTDTSKQALLMATAAIPGGLGVFTSTIMPDFVLGPMVLSAGLLIGYFERMSTLERAWHLVTIVLAVLFHQSLLLVALSIAGISALAYIRLRNFRKPTLALIAVVLSGIAGHWLVTVTVQHLTDQPIAQTPFLLARVVGDGTAEPYLKHHCHTEAYALCAYRAQMPMTENEFLFSIDPTRGVFAIADGPQRERILSEQLPIVIGILKDEPLDQLRASLSNILRQLWSVGATEYGNLGALSAKQPGFQAAIDRYAQSGVARGHMPLNALSTMMLASYLLGFVLLIAAGMSRLRDRERDRAAHEERDESFWIAATVAVFGLIANAVVCGAIAGVFDRYQGRGAWILITLALIAILRRRETATVDTMLGADDAAPLTV